MKRGLSALQIAAVYIGTIIGAGFATGKEIVEFFTRFGFYGFLSIFISGVLFIILGTKMMEKAIDIKAQSYEEFNEFLFGKTLSKAINLLTMVMLICVCGVMLSGAGAVFDEHLHVSRMIGMLITVLLTFIVMLIGSKGLFSVNTFVVPMMILFNALLMSHSVQEPNFLTHLRWRPNTAHFGNAITQALSYAAFNLALAQAVLVPIATEVNDKKTIRLGGIFGGLFLTWILISSHFSLVTLPHFTSYELPMAVIVKNSFPEIYMIYILMIYSEIFTSIIGNVYGLEKQLRGYLSINSIPIYIIILVITFLISQLHYGTLLSILYPIFGYFSLLFIVILGIKTRKI
ncbi:YkvI family membrane protein [Heyndrickxia ginsengihumi]|uniref:Membrane protein n=1 Tax=Heyndrickxia ginsengihumi TaxID=363870 RepID=A0A0A6VBK9_9BACI|nr:membrane protein [Heyndrickxia ginsengihumi]KHD84873.1 membrane protein [Heyndrickxia ginsengihumi]MBE6183586.1 hypothetical protein [Bacillus sp. (in: firmicutes)]MCM3024943.1 hypothetical protein [Heyndrickxia ginsengihumi]NEY18729.1 hypothetical protein [Heyndrickxia ginsengihumi]